MPQRKPHEWRARSAAQGAARRLKRAGRARRHQRSGRASHVRQGVGPWTICPRGRTEAMPEATFAVLMLVILGWAVVSDRLARWNVTGPMVFTVFGFVLANQEWGPLTVDVQAPSIHLLAELTLALLLFSDAARVILSMLR